ncbi:hypothetical protein BJ322DRAFT_1050218 [Thelephora terrestris]|uniref:RRM domain-containing protein n=1 Tax=Thelephora terrestris TaxID=56493 RepID=A0A9P6HJP2_9AGAM|nr:hypothetical protein BJ322DRAFT_1050218 [Thelephora terrestris]
MQARITVTEWTPFVRRLSLGRAHDCGARLATPSTGTPIPFPRSGQSTVNFSPMAFPLSAAVHTSVTSRENPSPFLSSASPPPPPAPSNADIEAVIQMATSNQGRLPIPKDTRTQLFVGNLPYRVRWQDLKDLFRKAGTVLRADVSLGPDNRSRGYGTVLLASAEDATRAVEMFNGYNWQTRTLEVRPDRIPPEFDGPNLTLTSSTGYHSPGPLLPGPLPQSTFTAPASAEELLALPRPLTAAATKSLFVGNLPFHCQWQDLKDLFRQAGTILRADVAFGPDGRSRGFGTVVFASEIDAERAVKMFNGYEFNGRALKVHYDRFSASQASTVPTSPVPGSQFLGSYAGPNSAIPPNHIPMPLRYPEFRSTPGATSPYDVYPPYLPNMPQVQYQNPSEQQTYPLPVNPHSASPNSAQPLDGRHPVERACTKSPVSPPSNSNFPHPGRIALPPPSVAGFPHPHTLSPNTLSPLHHPHHPISPLHHPHNVVTMTPHGLPPMTPSMPSFTFLPQPSPNVHGGPQLGNPPTNRQDGPQMGNIPHILTPYTPFSPGVTMSPGALWGRPGAGVNPYAAVGAPTHVQHQWVQHGSPLREEAGGYFPPVVPQEYFPFVPPSSSGLANEVVPDGESSAGDTDASVKESDGSESTQPGSEGQLPQLIRTEGSSQRSSDSFLRTEASPKQDSDPRIVTNSLENLTIGCTKRAWTSDSKLDSLVESETRGRTQASLPVELDGMSRSGGGDPLNSLPFPMLRAGSDPVPTHDKVVATLPPTRGFEQERRVSFAEVVSDGNTPGHLPRKRAAIVDGADGF